MAFGASALALFATTYFAIFAVMGVPIKKAPLAEMILGVEPETGAPMKPVVSAPAPTPEPAKASRFKVKNVCTARSTSCTMYSHDLHH